VRVYRKLRKLSQEELGALANVTQVEISRLETTPAKTPLRVFSAVCAALGISVADLLEDAPIVVDGDIRPSDVT
jgi:transcriptional regulator with XRE-family HTH domain